MQRAVQVAELLIRVKPNDMRTSTAHRNLSGKLTIIKGRYASADSFQESVRDKESQKDIHDRERLVQSDTRLDQLIATARDAWEADPTNAQAINTLVEQLCKRERESEEREAVNVLMKAHAATRNYRYKFRADDIRMRQLTREARRIQAKNDRQAAQRHLVKQLSFELAVFKERVENYPTDNRLKFEYARRLFTGRKYDEAIPVFQAARNDPKNQVICNVFIGRSFFEKKYYPQATDIFRETIEGYEIEGDERSKEMHYWLGRSLEAAGQGAEAGKVYGQLIQWDYNYRDVRSRLDALRGGRNAT
jgi:tetratricopeptide (TPR) repeat protein